MDETGRKLLSLMFRPDEKVCVSHNKYGYHAVPFEDAISDEVTLVSPNSDRPIEKVSTNNLTLVCLNPSRSWRSDENITAFRNILVEMDTGSLKSQLEYIKTINLPYSAAIFSGNKSIHFLISLDQDFPNEDTYRLFSRWILKAVPLADQKTFNPSRSIRIPGACREPKKKQRLIEFKGSIKMRDLISWVEGHPEAKPRTEPIREKSGDFSYDTLSPWAKVVLARGIDKRKGRSNQWYALAMEFFLHGYSKDDTLRILGGYFTPESDFKEKEWQSTVLSAFKRANKK